MADLPHANSVVFPGVAAPASGADVPIQALSTVPDGRLPAGTPGALASALEAAGPYAQDVQSGSDSGPDARPRAMSIGDLWTTIEPFHRCGLGLALISRRS
jgi:hypothetical protein